MGKTGEILLDEQIKLLIRSLTKSGKSSIQHIAVWRILLPLIAILLARSLTLHAPDSLQ